MSRRRESRQGDMGAEEATAPCSPRGQGKRYPEEVASWCDALPERCTKAAVWASHGQSVAFRDPEVSISTSTAMKVLSDQPY